MASSEIQENLRSGASTTTNISNISNRIIDDISLKIPPLSEQHRIVTKIEELLTQLDAGVASLKKVQAQLKRYRQAVLKAAFEGRLTQEWREKNQTDDKSLLEYLKRNWEKYHKGKKFTKIDFSNLLLLPEGWLWSNFDQISQRVTVGHVGPMKEEYIEHGIPFLRSQNVRSNRFDPDGLKYISPEFHTKIKKSTLFPNDIVVVRSGNVGVSCVIPEFLKEANCSDLVIVKQSYGILPSLGAYYMNSTALRLVNAKKVGVALTHFNTKSMAEMVVPLPPIEEQKFLLAEIERLFSIADEIELTITISLRQAETLRQSILKRAFEGKLVPQDPTDEPASILLERIKAEKALYAAEEKKGKTLQPKSPKRKIKNAN
jgi:type I restriction enzyme S subunit